MYVLFKAPIFYWRKIIQKNCFQLLRPFKLDLLKKYINNFMHKDEDIDKQYDILDDPYLGVNINTNKKSKPTCDQLERILNK